MTEGRLSSVMLHLRRLIRKPADLEEADGWLLERFVRDREEAAFARLMERHGPMVFGVCRRVLHDTHAAEDAFQATFLVLARKAQAIRRQESLGGWLGRVAFRVAVSARAAAERQAARERIVAAMSRTETEPDADRRQLHLILEEELQALPRKYYEPLVLCYLEGRTHEEAARLLSWPEGTVKGRMARGRDMLHTRLVRRGVTLAGGALPALLTETASALVPSRLIGATLQAALLVVSGKVAAVSAPAAALADGVMHAWRLARLKLAAAIVLLCGTVAAGAVIGLGQVRWEAAPAPAPGAAADAQFPAGAAEVRATVDAYGDSLPPNALARLGSVRFRVGSRVPGLALSPDGKVLVSSSYDGVQLWDAANGRLLRQLPTQATHRVFFAADGTLIATGNGTLHCWQGAGDKELRQVKLQADGYKPANVRDDTAVSPDGKLLASIGAGGREHSWLYVWDGTTGKELRRWQVPAAADHLAFSPDGKLLASSGAPWGEDQIIRLWDPATGAAIRALPGCNQTIQNLTFAPDGQTLVSGGPLGAARPGQNIVRRSGAILWDVAAGKQLAQFHGQQEGYSCPVAISPDGKTLALGDEYRSIRLWDIASRQERAALGSFPSYPTALAFSADGRQLLSADEDGVLRHWDLATGKETTALQGHQGKVGPVAWSADGKSVVTFADQTVRVWDARTGKQRRQFGPVPHTAGMRCAFAPDLSLFLAVQAPRFQVWNVAQGKLLRERTMDEQRWCQDTAISPDLGRFAVTANNNVTVWDMATGKALHRLNMMPVPNTGIYTAFSPDGKVLAGNLPYGVIYLWDAATGRQLHCVKLHEMKGEDEWLSITCLTFTADGKVLAAVNQHGATIAFLDAASGRLLRWVNGQANAHFHQLSFAPDGRTFAVGNGKRVQWWEMATDTPIREFQGHCGDVGSLAFSPDSKVLATASHDSSVLLWDVHGLTADDKRQAEKLAAKELETLWNDLGAVDAAAGYRAGRILLASPQGLPYLQTHLKPVAAPPAERLRKLIADLDGEQFAVRRRAEQELAALGELAEPSLQQALADKLSLELRQRIEGLLQRLQQQPSTPERLRGLRAVVALEHAATPAARQLLQALAEGAPGARTTKEARLALDRLAKAAAAD